MKQEISFIILLFMAFTTIGCHKSSPSIESIDKNKAIIEAQGTESSGGGSFSESSFRSTAQQILTDMLTKSLPSEDTQQHIEALSPLIENHSKVKVIISDKPLYHPIKGKVDALNFKKRKEIHLFKPVWDRRFESKTEIRHLVLHEYFGLTDFNDEEMRISLKYYPAIGESPDWEATHLQCQASAWGIFLTENDNITWRTLSYTSSSSLLVKGKGKFSPRNGHIPTKISSLTLESKELEHLFGFNYRIQITATMIRKNYAPIDSYKYIYSPRTPSLRYSARLFLIDEKEQLIGVGRGSQDISGKYPAQLSNFELERLAAEKNFHHNEGEKMDWPFIRDGFKVLNPNSSTSDLVTFFRKNQFPKAIPFTTKVECELTTPID